MKTDVLSRIELVLVATIIIAGLAFWTWTDFADARKDAQSKVLAASIAMDELAHRSLLAVDVVLESAVATVAVQGLDKLGPRPEHLRRIASRLPETGAIFVVDKAGNTVAGTVPYPSGSNVSDREWFNILKQGKEEIHVGRALKGRSVHNLFFPVARSIRAPDGSFIGAVQVGIEVTYIAYLFRSLDVGPDAHLGLYSTRDGTVVARYPMTEALLDDTVAALPFFSELAKSQAQSWTGWTRNHDQEQLVSARRLNGWPLIAAAGLPMSTVYNGAWTRLLWRIAIATVMIAALAMFTAVGMRQARREASLISELEHRVKNMLAVVATMIERTRERHQSIEGFLSSFRARIQSMAGTQTLLSQSRWQGVGLADLIRRELEPYATGTNTNLDGPSVYLTPIATHGLAMVIHELTTNAAKYGALSRPGGQVSVRWALSGEGSPAPLKVQWNEAGGPEVGMPTQQGYGSSVIRDLLAYELGGRVDFVLAPDGVRCTIELPAQSIVENSRSEYDVRAMPPDIGPAVSDSAPGRAKHDPGPRGSRVMLR